MTESYLLLTYSRNFSCKGKAYKTSTQNDNPVLLWQPWENGLTARKSLRLNVCFQILLEPLRLHEVGHCILRPTGYFSLRWNKQLWCVKCGVLCISWTLLPHGQTNKSTPVGTVLWHAVEDMAQMCLHCPWKVAGWRISEYGWTM